jgi:formylaminopyrimidine deformylase / aminopyrimidine aminohydrolase
VCGRGSLGYLSSQMFLAADALGLSGSRPSYGAGLSQIGIGQRAARHVSDLPFRHMTELSWSSLMSPPHVLYGGGVPVAALLKLPQWDAATRHPFLRTVGEGTASTFGVWLAQDALFVANLVVFQARLVARAPRSAQGVLARGVVGLVAELDWFDIQAASLGVSLEVAPMRATRDYQALLSELDEERYARAVVGLWVLERVYLEAWRYAASYGRAGPYAAAVAHWTDPAFASYVAALEELADVALAQEADDAVEDVVGAVLAHEVAFWDMAEQRDG